jgi:hypothetical protein
MRSLRTLAALGLAAGLVAGCAGGTPSGGPAANADKGGDRGGDRAGEPPADKPVEFTLTAEELAKAFDADEAAFKAKYGGKRVELTGVVELPRIRARGPNDVLLHGVAKPKQFFAQYVFVTPRKADQDKYEGMRALARGQSVTVRGEVGTFGVVLSDCEFVKVGPSPALPVAPSELPAALGTPEGKQKYDGKAVVTRGEVREAKWNGTVATLMLGDPGKKDGPALEASLNPREKEVGEEMGRIKPGAVVVVLGDGDTLNDGRIWNARVLKAPPEGVTLPEPGKK